MLQRRNVSADSRTDLERVRLEAWTTYTSSERKRRSARIRMLDRKARAVVAAVVVVGVVDVVDQAEVDRAEEDQAAEDRAEEEARVEEDRAEAAAASIVVQVEEEEEGEVAEEAAGVAVVVEAEVVEASRSVHGICLFRPHASKEAKEELVRASLGGSTLQPCDTHLPDTYLAVPWCPVLTSDLHL
jgi:hypothetical protein